MQITALVIGAGPVGRSTAAHLSARGHSVAVMTRSGTRVPRLPAIAGDATLDDDLRRAHDHFPATHIIACLHAPYSARQWRTLLLPAEQAILRVATERGIHVTFPESVYAFGPGTPTVSDGSEPRALSGKPGVRAQLLRLRREAAAPTCSVVASDYYGPGCAHGSGSVAHSLVFDRLAAGKAPLALFRRHTPHAFTYLPDFARALADASESGATGIRVTPTVAPVSQHDLAALAARVLGRTPRKPIVLGSPMLWAAGAVDRDVAGVVEMKWLWTAPQTLESSFGWEPTALEEGVRAALTPPSSAPRPAA